MSRFFNLHASEARLAELDALMADLPVEFPQDLADKVENALSEAIDEIESAVFEYSERQEAEEEKA